MVFESKRPPFAVAADLNRRPGRCRISSPSKHHLQTPEAQIKIARALADPRQDIDAIAVSSPVERKLDRTTGPLLPSAVDIVRSTNAIDQPRPRGEPVLLRRGQREEQEDDNAPAPEQTETPWHLSVGALRHCYAGWK